MIANDQFYEWLMLDPRLEHAVAVARAGSFTAAANLVGVTQSAITRSVADLERRIGYAIFYRTARGALLTENGRAFVDRADRLLEDARALLNGSPQPRDPYAGPLRIGVCPASLEWCLVEPLARLLIRYPKIRYDVSSSNFETILQQLRTGKVDVAIGFDTAFSDCADLHRTPIGTFKYAMFVRKGHPLVNVKQLKPVEISQFDFVSPSDSRPSGEVIRSIYEISSGGWESRLHRVDYFPLVRSIVASSDAIGIVATSYASSTPFMRAFEILDLADPLLPPSPLCCATRARWEAKPAARALIGTLSTFVPSYGEERTARLNETCRPTN